MSDDDLLKNVRGMVRMGFNEAGEDYDNPTKEGIIKVLQYLGRASASWGTPEEIIEHHKKELKKIITAL
ncbi:MAG: hypothetical protein ABIH89_00125 [Elusimicrobiota bacterium]